MTLSIKHIFPLALALSVLLSYQFLGAQWAAPTAADPATYNTPAPLNIGADEQTKNGSLGVNALSVYGQGYVQGTTTTKDELELVGLDVHGTFGSERYCDRNGENCVTAEQVRTFLDTPPAPEDCELDGVTVANGASDTFYNRTSDYNCSNYTLERTCTDGVLDGDTSYAYATCTSPGCVANQGDVCRASGDPLLYSCRYTNSSGMWTNYECTTNSNYSCPNTYGGGYVLTSSGTGGDNEAEAACYSGIVQCDGSCVAQATAPTPSSGYAVDCSTPGWSQREGENDTNECYSIMSGQSSCPSNGRDLNDQNDNSVDWRLIAGPYDEWVTVPNWPFLDRQSICTYELNN